MAGSQAITLDTPQAVSPHLAAVQWGLAALALAALLTAPLVLDSYVLHALIFAMIFLLPAHGLNLILGYTGMLSLAQGVFFGISAYASALLSMHFGTPFVFNLCAAAVVAALVALPLGILGEHTLAITQIPHYFYLVLAVAVLATLLFIAVIRSPAGRCMVAIRDNETLAESLGVPTWHYKLIVFMLSAAFAGLGGSLYAHYETVVSPLVFQMYYSNTILIIVLGGGVGRVTGAVIGSFLFVALTEALRVAPELRMLLYGFVLLGLVFIFPQGLAPLLERGTEWMARLSGKKGVAP